MVASDVAMLENTATPVLKALRPNGINVVAIHHHMADVKPVVIFRQYHGTGSGRNAGAGSPRRRDLLGKTSSSNR
jgi:hypothetical protein